jgi:hypothetical protein
MVAPTRFPAGISTFKRDHVLNTFPVVPNQYQTGAVVNEMTPYTAGSFTVTATTATVGGGVWNAAGGALVSGYNGGIVSMAVTTASGGKAGIVMDGNSAAINPVQFIPGNQVWFSANVAFNKGLMGYYATGAGSLSAGDATAVTRVGLIDIADPTGTITNGVYFEVPGTKNTVASAANLVIKNTGLTGSTVTTTIKNICDLARPSGLFGDTTSFTGDPAAALTTAGSSNKYTSIAVATAGAGYAIAPLVRTTGAGAASPYAQAYCQINGGTGQTAQPGNVGPLGAGLYAPYLCHVGGTGYSTFTNEVNPWINLSLYYNGKGVLFVGVNGRLVATVGIQNNVAPTSNNGVAMAAGATVDTASGNNFIPSNASMTTSIAPVLPAANTFDLIMPMTPLCAGAGYALNTAATNIMFLDNLTFGSEYN